MDVGRTQDWPTPRSFDVIRVCTTAFAGLHVHNDLFPFGGFYLQLAIGLVLLCLPHKVSAVVTSRVGSQPLQTLH